MNEKYVTSLEISKQMKEAGIVQSSEFYWVRKIKDGEFVLQDHYIDRIIPCEVYSAFTSGEMGEMLPGNIDGMYFVTQWGFLHNICYCTAFKDEKKVIEFDGQTEAECRAEMLLHLIQNGFINIKDIKI